MTHASNHIDESWRGRHDLARSREAMATLGRVAAAVAHEVNNLLQPVISLTEIELESVPRDGTGADQESRENLEMVIESGRQMRDLLRKMLMVARKHRPKLTPVDFPAALRRTVDVVRAGMPLDVRIVEIIACAPGLMARLDEAGLIDVLTAFLDNAARAMRATGVVTIRLRAVPLDKDDATSRRLAEGVYFELAVTDTGHGMDTATMARLFEPFFTTKPDSEGMGLGLPVAQAVVRDWNGAIAVESAPGRGATFTVYLPVLAAP